MRIDTGIKGRITTKVGEADTAAAVGSGELDVLSTPSMIALMERTVCSGINPYLDEGMTTVGTLINIRHVSATLIGMEIKCECELTHVDGNRLVFSVSAYDQQGLIGEGVHERYIVNSEKFLSKVMRKRVKDNG